MKSLVIVCCLAVALGVGVAVSCGPQKPYCAGETNGECVPPPVDAGQDIPDVGIGESIIFM